MTILSHWRIYHWATWVMPPPLGRQPRAKRGSSSFDQKCSKSKVSHTANQSCHFELINARKVKRGFYSGLTARVWPSIIFFWLYSQLNTAACLSVSRMATGFVREWQFLTPPPWRINRHSSTVLFTKETFVSVKFYVCHYRSRISLRPTQWTVDNTPGHWDRFWSFVLYYFRSRVAYSASCPVA